MEPRPQDEPLEEASTAALVREAIAEARELVEIEVKLARQDIEQEVARLKRAALGFGVAAAFLVLALSLFALAGVIALGGTWLVALAFGAGFLFAAVVGALLGRATLSQVPLTRTRERVKNEIGLLKEHVA